MLLPIDLQANLGVDVNDLNKQMAQVLAELKKSGKQVGLYQIQIHTLNSITMPDYYSSVERMILQLLIT